VPVDRFCAVQRTALAALTPNRSAAARRLIPPFTAATTRSRRSTNKHRAMPAGLRSGQQSE